MQSGALFASLAERLPLTRPAWGDSAAPQAAVLVAVTDEHQPRVILGRRSLHLPLHPGEVAFPGGKREPADASPWETAQREAMEEVGIASELVYPLGELAPLLTRTGFEVHPCIARIPAGTRMVVDAREFDSVFLPPLALFADPALFRVEPMHDGQRTRMVPHYDLEDDTVWGVTAAILAQLANAAYDAGLDLQRNWETTP